MDHMKGIICIGRQYGSGGREVGEKLARKLGIPCYDKLLIKKAALESGLSTDFISGNPYADIASIGNTFYSESQVTFNAEKEVIEKIEFCLPLFGSIREFDTSKLKRILQSLETGLFFCQIFVFII